MCACERESDRERARESERARERERTDIFSNTMCVFVYERETTYLCICVSVYCYGVAMIIRLLKIIGLFCRISSLLKGSFAEETYNFKEPINRRHPICC